uniref:Centromere/kinetochore protein zw10 homolog n=2 Tax=Biomphalaria glabrata TaxID=6526 RepID=A0A2C9LLH4_BIOGL
MASFVEKILQNAGMMEKKLINEKLELLTKKLTELEAEIYQLVKTKYISYYPCLEASESLCQRVQDINNEIYSLEQKIKQESNLFSVNSEFCTLNQELVNSKQIFSGLQYLVEINDLLQTAKETTSDGSLTEAANALNKLESYFKNNLGQQKEKITILKTLEVNFKIQKATLETVVCTQWSDSIKWISSSDSEFKVLTLSIATDRNLKDVVHGLQACHILERHMKKFAENFQKLVLPLVLEEPELAIESKSASSSRELRLKTPNSKKGSVDCVGEEQMYKTVFANLLLVLEHLNSMLLKIDFQQKDELQQGSGQTLMNWLGEEVASSFLDSLKQTVLAKAIPSNIKDLDGFRSVIDATQILQDKLLTLGFLQLDDQSLMTYVQNINMLFANKKSQTIIEKARDLMTSNLFESLAVNDTRPLSELPPLSSGPLKAIVPENVLSENTFKMPKCNISQNIDTLVQLAYETMCEATGSEECAIQMFYSVRSMFEMFCHVVPTHHAHSLKTVPQLAALHHNNCMYIAHHLMTMGHQFAPKLPREYSVTFVDLIQQIRKNGIDVMIAQVQRQKDLLMEYLDGSEGFSNLETESNIEKAKKSVGQVVFQLEHLKKIWKPVLPINNYKKALGQLIKSVVTRVVDSVIALEDIAQDASQRILELLTSLEKVCGECLTSPGEVASVELTRHCLSWPRFTELKLVLNSSLTDIADRWAEGKGPLASAFTAMELKKLIRALFQNTERRGNLLALIK